MKKIKQALSLSPRAVAILAHVGNRSAYVDQLIIAHAERTRRAVDLLRSRGWTDDRILRAADAAVAIGGRMAGDRGDEELAAVDHLAAEIIAGNEAVEASLRGQK